MDVKYSRTCRKVVFWASAALARVADATKPKIAACFVVAALVYYLLIGPVQRDGTVTYAFRPDATREPSIRFEVCEGLTNQRIAIVQGVAIGHLTGLPIVLPSMHTVLLP